jgi:predicted Fe-Mo cluster-binding NifX family protein
MGPKKIKIAIPTQEKGGLSDIVANVFARAATFTIIDIQNLTITNIDVIKNPAISYKHGAGPIVAKTLIDCGVTFVFATEFGPGVSTILDQHNVERINIESGCSVSEIIKMFILNFQNC